MNREQAIETLPIYSRAVRIMDEEPVQKPKRKHLRFDSRQFQRKYGIVLIAAFLFCIYTICLSAIIKHNTEKDVRSEMLAWHDAQMEAYKAEQAQAEQASHWLSGDASREAAINQEVDAVAQVIARLSTDAQKLTEACCMLARVMSPSYPNTFKEVASQPSQWMFFDGTVTTFTEHDRELANSVVRPYMEDGIVPNGLTASMVYGEWTPTDFVLRDTWEAKSSAHYWRWS